MFSLGGDLQKAGDKFITVFFMEKMEITKGLTFFLKKT